MQPTLGASGSSMWPEPRDAEATGGTYYLMHCAQNQKLGSFLAKEYNVGKEKQKRVEGCQGAFLQTVIAARDREKRRLVTEIPYIEVEETLLTII